MKTKEEIEQLIIDAEEEFRIFERMSADTGRKVLDLITKAVENNGILPIVINCTTCKHINCSKYVDPCYSCNDFSHHER